MNLHTYLQERQQDGVLWKAGHIWSTALNPDLAVKAQEQIVVLLLCMPNPQKRSHYVNKVTQMSVDLVQAQTDKVDDIQGKIKLIDKELAKLQRKANPDEGQLGIISGLQEEKKQLENLRAIEKNNTLPKIDLKDLTKQIKDEQAARERKAKQILEKKNINSQHVNLENLGLPLDFEGNVVEVIKFQIHIRFGKYYSKRGADDWEEISNFTMRIINFVDTGADAAYRLISVKNEYAMEKIIVLNTDDFTSVGTFKKVLARQGNFVFKGNDTDLTRLAEYLQKDENPADRIDVLGYHPKGKFYAYSNGLVDCADPENKMTFYPVDEYGIVSIRDRSYFIPANSKMYSEKEELFVNEKKFVYTANTNIDFSSWSKLHRLVYKDHAVIGQLWVISALFRDIIKSINEINCTPILNLFGQRGSGKTQYAESLMALGGYAQPAIGLGSHSTPKGFLRKFAQFRNWIVWLEEYKNNIKKDFIEAAKNIFDGISYTRAMKTNGFDTDSLPVNSAGIISGQEMPIVEPALFSRVIMQVFTPGKDYTDEERLNFKRLKNFENGGLSSIACEILKTRPAFLEKFRDTYSRVLKDMFKRVDNTAMDDRFIVCISIMAAIRETLDGLLPFSFTIEEAYACLITNVRNQFAVMEGNDDLGKWWQIVENLVAQKLLRAREHFLIEDNVLYLKINDVVPFYIKELVARRDANPLSKSTLEDYIKNDKETYIEYKKHRIRKGVLENSTWCHCFKYNKLEERYNIDLSYYSSSEESNIVPDVPGPFTPGADETQWQQWSSKKEG